MYERGLKKQTHQALKTEHTDAIKLMRYILAIETQEPPLHDTAFGILRLFDLPICPDVL